MFVDLLFGCCFVIICLCWFRFVTFVYLFDCFDSLVGLFLFEVCVLICVALCLVVFDLMLTLDSMLVTALFGLFVEWFGLLFGLWALLVWWFVMTFVGVWFAWDLLFDCLLVVCELVRFVWLIACMGGFMLVLAYSLYLNY